MIASKPSFSYTNDHTTKERLMRKINKNKVEDNELGIFGAEKYFKGVLDEEHLKTSNQGVHCGSNWPQERHEKLCQTPKPKTPIRIHSETSWNSRRGLLTSNGPNGNNESKKTSVKSLLASLGCNCNNKGSIKIEESKQPVKGGDLGQTTKSSSSKRAEEDAISKREDCFTFPSLNLSMSDVKHPKLPKAKQERDRMETKQTMLKFEGVTSKAEVSDTGSDGSSDLFELESFSTNENNLFCAQQDTKNNLFLASQEADSNMYAPSEASVNWSIATASVADFPTHENLVVTRNAKSSGILSGCKSVKGVRVSGDEQRLAVRVSPTSQEWRSRLDSTTPVAKIQADTKLICAGSGLHISQNRFGLARQDHRTHSTHGKSPHLYM